MGPCGRRRSDELPAHDGNSLTRLSQFHECHGRGLLRAGGAENCHPSRLSRLHDSLSPAPGAACGFQIGYARGLQVLLKILAPGQSAGESVSAVPDDRGLSRPIVSDADERRRATEQARLEDERHKAAEQKRLEEERKQAAEQARVEQEHRRAAEAAGHKDEGRGGPN